MQGPEGGAPPQRTEGAGIRALAREVPPAQRGLAAGIAGAIFLAAPAWMLGGALVSGDWASRQAWAAVVPAIVVVIVAAPVVALGVIASGRQRRPWLAPALAAAG